MLHASDFLLRRELKYRLLMEPLIRPQDRRRKIRMVGRIGEVLRFQAEAVAAFVDVAMFPGDGAIEKISGVELDAGLRGGDFEDAAAGVLVDARR